MKERGGDRLKFAINESTLSTADAVPLPQWGRLRYENAAIPETQPSPREKAKRRRLRRKKGSQPRLAALRSPFQGKGLARTLPPSYGRREYAASQTSHEEGLRYENAAFPHFHFERKREIFFVRGQAKDVRIAASGKHRAPRESEGRCFMQTALRRKTEMGNEKDPSAALGMTKRGKNVFSTQQKRLSPNER